MIKQQRVARQCWIEIARPEKANALTYPMLLALQAIVQAALADPHCDTLIFWGAGRHFCAGVDLNLLLPLTNATRHEALAPFKETLTSLSQTHKRIIALCQGAARGGAIGLLAVCTEVIADPEATFACPERQQGILPTIITPFVTQAIPNSAAALLSGTVIWDASTALAHQLIQHIDPRVTADTDGYAWLQSWESAATT